MRNLKLFGLLSLTALTASIPLLQSNSASTDRLINVPANSKITFVKDFIIPPNEISIPLGVDSSGGYKTECKLYLNSYDPAIRKVPAGTEFLIKDTKETYMQRVDLLITSSAIQSIACATHKPATDPSFIMSASGLSYTKINQAQRALGNKIKITINDQPKLILPDELMQQQAQQQAQAPGQAPSQDPSMMQQYQTPPQQAPQPPVAQ